MTRSISQGRRDGFSLLELIVVMGILAVVTTLGSTAFITMNTWWNQLRSLSDLDNEADAVFERLQEDFDQALPPSASGTTVSSSQGLYDADLRFYRVGLADDAIVIPVYVTLGERGRVVAGKVRYSISRSANSYRLVRHTAALGGEWPEEGQVVAENIAGLDIQYPSHEGKFWTDEWTGEGNPPLVRVSLLLMDPFRSDAQITRAMVMAIHVD
jgi:prepilin-type N-terminal cleavage/methylation domain-containing protein